MDAYRANIAAVTIRAHAQMIVEALDDKAVGRTEAWTGQDIDYFLGETFWALGLTVEELRQHMPDYPEVPPPSSGGPKG